jgi:putative polymerase
LAELLIDTQVLPRAYTPPPPLGLNEEAGRTLLSVTACALLVATILFNPLLAWANGHVAPISASIVSVMQGGIVVAALLLGLLQPPVLAARWWIATALLVMAVLLIGAIRAQFNPKALGDVLLIPAFILLGTAIRADMFRRTMLLTQTVILIVGAWELMRPAQYGDLFNVVQYYVNTRGYDADAFWAGGSLFLSSERPGGRLLLGGFGFHRGSSLFLEPVSLGNWAVVATLFTAACWHELSLRARAYMIASTFALLVVCDGRLALTVALIFCLYLPISQGLPDRWSAAYLPGMILLLSLGGHLGLLMPNGDNFAGRLGIGINAWGTMDVERLLGISRHMAHLDDAGWADFVQSQSIFVALGLWLLLTLTGFGPGRGNRMAKHGIMLFIILCLPISNSLLSIKTAATMWALYGLCFARWRKERDETMRAPALA